MKYASKTSYFAFFLALKRLILQIFGRQNVLFCIIHQVEEGGCAECPPASYFIPLPSSLIPHPSSILPSLGFCKNMGLNSLLDRLVCTFFTFSFYKRRL